MILDHDNIAKTIEFASFVFSNYGKKYRELRFVLATKNPTNTLDFAAKFARNRRNLRKTIVEKPQKTVGFINVRYH